METETILGPPSPKLRILGLPPPPEIDTTPATPNPLSGLRVVLYMIPPFKKIPNTSVVKKPLLHYHAAFDPKTVTAVGIENHLAAVGVVEPQWRWTMFGRTHFHTTTHEVLCVYRGRARLCFGGEENPDRVELVATRGDVLVVPAGVGHRLLEDIRNGGGENEKDKGKGDGGGNEKDGGDGEKEKDDDQGGAFGMVGSYPPGYEWDMCWGTGKEAHLVKKMRKLPWFDKDPVYGSQGPVLSV